MINFDYDKVIILKYLPGGGGKFLCACLGLSDDAVLMREDLAQMQLNNKLPIEKKLKYLLLATKEQSEKKIWEDWGLRGGFWNINLTDYLQCGKEDISRKSAPIVNKCIENNKFIFQTVHDDKTLISMLRYWKNSKVIIFKNEQKFSSKRTLGFQGRSSTNFGRSSITGNDRLFVRLVKNSRKFSTNSSCSITKLGLDQSQINNLSYEWDCDWYFSKDKTISEIEKLYDSFGLSGFNAEMISEFYEAWINAIKFELR